MACDRAFGQLRGEALERCLGVGDDAKCNGARYADVARVDVDMNELALRGIAPVLVVGHVEIAKPGAHDQQDVGIAAQLVGGRTLRREIQRVIVRNDGACRHRRNQRTLEAFRQRDQRGIGLAAIDAATGKDHRCLRQC